MVMTVVGHNAARFSIQRPRTIVTGTCTTSAQAVSGAVVTVHDRALMATLGAAHSGADGAYRIHVAAEFAGLRRLLVVATYPDDQYNAVVADRVMPETVIE